MLGAICQLQICAAERSKEGAAHEGSIRYAPSAYAECVTPSLSTACHMLISASLVGSISFEDLSDSLTRYSSRTRKNRWGFFPKFV